MKELPKLHRTSELPKEAARAEAVTPQSDREQLVWKSLVHYVNADLGEITERFKHLLKATASEHARFRRPDELYGDPYVLHELTDFLPSLAIRYQGDLRSLLTWLCRPKSHRELRDTALRFLEAEAHAEYWHIKFDDDPTADDFSEESGPSLYFIKQVAYGSVVSPVCKFVFEYVDDPPKALPIRVCGRPGCGRFILPERTGRKRYCSARCCALMNKKSPEENRDYMWLYRLEKRPRAVLCAELNKPKVRGRLLKIEARYPNLAKKVGEIHARIIVGRRKQ